MNSITLAWLAEVVLITYRSASQKSAAPTPLANVPLPSSYVASFIIFGTLSLVPGQGQRVASVFAWGVVAATVLNLWDPAGGVKQITQTTKPPAKVGA